MILVCVLCCVVWVAIKHAWVFRFAIDYSVVSIIISSAYQTYSPHSWLNYKLLWSCENHVKCKASLCSWSQRHSGENAMHLISYKMYNLLCKMIGNFVSNNLKRVLIKTKYTDLIKPLLQCLHTKIAVSPDRGFISLRFVNPKNSTQQNY